MAFDPDIQRGVELLTLCQEHQCAKDGVDRPAPGVVDQSKTLDQFARDFDHTISLLAQTQTLRGAEARLRSFAEQHPELVEVRVGESFSEGTLDWLESAYRDLPTGNPPKKWAFTEEMLNAALKKAVKTKLIPKTVDGMTFLQLRDCMKQVLQAALDVAEGGD